MASLFNLSDSEFWRNEEIWLCCTTAPLLSVCIDGPFFQFYYYGKTLFIWNFGSSRTRREPQVNKFNFREENTVLSVKGRACTDYCIRVVILKFKTPLHIGKLQQRNIKVLRVSSLNFCRGSVYPGFCPSGSGPHQNWMNRTGFRVQSTYSLM